MSMVERGILERREGLERARVERSGATPVAAAKHRLRGLRWWLVRVSGRLAGAGLFT